MIYGYCRLSVDRQESLSIETQRAAIVAYCVQRFSRETFDPDRQVYADPGVSAGISLGERPEGAKLLALLKRGDHVVVAKLDRAFRSVSDAADTITEFDRRGVSIHFLDLQVDTSTPVGRLIIHVIAAFAQLERERIGERIRDANKHRRSQGVPWMPAWCAPKGWKIQRTKAGRKFTPWEAERKQCREILRLRKRGLTIRAIMQRLYDRGVRSLRTKRPLAWGTTRRMLQAALDGFPLLSHYCRTVGSESEHAGRIDWHKAKSSRTAAKTPSKRSYSVKGLGKPGFGVVDGTRPEIQKPRYNRKSLTNGADDAPPKKKKLARKRGKK